MFCGGRVRKRRNILSINGNEAANQPEKLEQQPRSSDILLLANGDEGHESEVPDAEGLLENSHRKKRKRKSPEKLRGSKYLFLCSSLFDLHKLDSNMHWVIYALIS